MALSGSIDFAVTRDTLIKAALQHIGAIGDGDTPNATQLSEGSILLNMLVKHWKVHDIQLWIKKYGFILPISNTSTVSMGAEGSVAVTGYRFTTTSAASAISTSTITVTTVTGISNGDQIGIELNTGVMQWTTVNGAPVGSVVTLTAALTAAVSSGAAVYVYTQSSQRAPNPARVLLAFRRTSSETLANVIDLPMTQLSEQEYILLSAKTQGGPPLQWWVDYSLTFGASGQPGNSDFNFWPRFENGKNVIVYRYEKIFDDVDAGTNDFEFPQEWYLPLMVGLAWLESPKHGIPIRERSMLFQEMNFFIDQAKTYDQEQGSLFISAERRN